MRINFTFRFWVVAVLCFANELAAELPVPCGACNGGVWVSSGSASLSNSTNSLTIDQHTDRAILNWQEFNIGAGNAVNFRQPSSSSVALNRIFQSDPSRILGALNANGQVLLINQNGFLFGSGAEINTHSLVASSLGITDQVFESLGITGAINEGQAAFAGGGAGDIDIAAGAELNAKKDGRILIIAPTINNRGRLNAPDGQVILAASHDKVYLEASGDPDLRGLLVEVETGGDVNNIGKIVTERGNTTLLGAAVNQNGLVRATTSVTRNGSVSLLARDNANTIPVAGSTRRTAIADRAGTVSLGVGSTTEVVVDTSDTDLASDAQAQAVSKIDIVGKKITLESQALIKATGGEVDLLAAENLLDPVADFFVKNEASITIKNGSLIDVSGATGETIPFERNLVEVDLRGNELRDNPVNRNGPVRGETVIIDARQGTKFADVSAFIEATERSASERLADGGSVRLRSEGTIKFERGATVDISGGQVDYSGGFNTASYLIREGGLTPIAEADPNIFYDGVFNFVENQYEKWSVTEIFNPFRSDPLWQIEIPYSEGADAGSLHIVTRDLDFSGRTIAKSIRGVNQRYPANSSARVYEQLPNGGLVTIGDTDTSTNDFKLGEVVLTSDSPADEDIIAINVAALAQDGVSRLQIFSNEKISVPENTIVELPDGGELSLRGANIEVAGQVIVRGGEVELEAGASVSTNPGDAQLELLPQASIVVSGRWINDFQDVAAGRPLAALFYDAGQVRLLADGPLRLNEGSVIDAIGGGLFSEDAALVPGIGGDVSIAVSFSTGTPPELALGGAIRGYALDEAGTLAISGPAFRFGGRAVSGVTHIDETFFASTGFADYSFTANESGISVEANTELELIRHQLILGTGGTEVDVPSAVTDNAVDGNAFFGIADIAKSPTNTDIFSIAKIGRLPQIDRSPVNLSLNLERAPTAGGNGEISVSADTKITTDPGATISLISDRDLFFNGQINAPASTVLLQTKRRESAEEGYLADQTLWLGNRAAIDVSAIFFDTSKGNGFREGFALHAGSITLAANRGYLVGQAGADLNLSGTHGTIDLLNDASLLPTYNEQIVTGAAGTLNLRSGDGIFFDANVNQAPASAQLGRGGVLNVGIDGNLRATRIVVPGAGLPFPATPRQIRIGGELPTNLSRNVDFAPELNGQAIVGERVLTHSGIDNLTLNAPAQGGGSGLIATGQVIFDKDTVLSTRESIQLITPEIQLNNAHVSIIAPVVELGAATQNFRFDSSLSTGSGSLSVSADLIALRGQLALNGARPTATQGGSISLNANNDLILAGTPLASNASDIRGNLSSGSDILLRAERIYPTSFSDFEIHVDRLDGSITTVGTTAGTTVGDPNRNAPYSVAGSLTLRADSITHGGTIAAPFGEISFDARQATLNPESLLSVSGDGQEFLFGKTQFELDWLLPFPNINVVLDRVPEKRVDISADQISIQPGALIDLSGGGDLRAYEFVPGPGGSSDILDLANRDGAFAIVPGLNSQPLDPVVGFASNRFGQTFVASENELFAAGEYAVLPAEYALLPNAYLVRPVGEQAVAANITRVGSDGLPLIAGKFDRFGTNIQDSEYSSFQILNGQQLRDRSEFVESLASGFFAAAPIVPADNGSLSLTAATALEIGGSVLARGSGRPSSIDLVADNIAVVNRIGEGLAGSVEILASDLSRLGNGSVLIGGSREILSSSVSKLNVLADTVQLIADTSVIRNEIILAAAEDLIIGENVTLTATGNPLPSRQLALDGAGALVAVSSGALSLSRTNAMGPTGDINVGNHALISAPGTVILDASADATLGGRIEAAGSQVSLGGAAIAIGDVPLGARGLILSGDTLRGLENAESLNLRSSTTIDLFGNADLSFGRLRLDSVGLFGQLDAGDSFRISAVDLSLAGSDAVTPLIGSEQGNLTLNANRLNFEGGNTGLYNFAGTAINTDVLSWSGDTTLSVTSDLSVATNHILATESATFAGTTAGNLSVSRAAIARTQVAEAALGGELNLVAESVNFSTDVTLPSGKVTLESTVGGVDTLNANFMLGGQRFDYDGTLLGSPGGVFSVRSSTDINLADTLVDVSGAAGAGGGTITLYSDDSLELSSTEFTANTSAELKVIAGTTDVNRLLESAGNGFTREFDLRLRSGDIEIATDTTISAQRISLVADSADVLIAGSLLADASDNGGQIRIFAGDRLTIGDTATLAARGLNGSGGLVELGTSNGTLAVAAALIDTTGGNGSGGGVRVRAPIVGDDVDISVIDANLAGVDFLEVEAISTSNGTINDALNALNAFAPNLASVATRLGIDTLDGARVVPGAELQLDSNYVTSSALNLLSRRYGDLPGILTVRASGDININHDISDGIINYDPFPGQLPPREAADTKDSWSYRFVAGADLLSADPLATVRGGGDFTVGNNVRIRTGTGTIDLSGGGDLNLQGTGSVIYTVGLNRGSGAFGPLLTEAYLEADFLRDGGSISLSFDQDITAVTRDQLVNDWLARFEGEDNFAGLGAFATGWGININRFRQGIGTLGGGNIRIRSGGEISALGVVAPTTGLPVGPRGSTPERAGGGAIDIGAGGDFVGGLIYAAEGDATLRSGGSIRAQDDASNGIILAAGDSKIRLFANQDIDVLSAFDPFLLPQSAIQGAAVFGTPVVPIKDETFFPSYSSDAAISLASVTGTIRFSADVEALADISSNISITGSDRVATSVIPPNLSLISHGGGIEFTRSFTLFPSADSQLEMFAGGDITLAQGTRNSVLINFSDADPANLPNVSSPTRTNNILADRLGAFDNATGTSHATVPLHVDDLQPVKIVSRNGSLGTSGSQTLGLSLAKSVDIYAEQGVRNINLLVQHAKSDDVSVIQSNADIFYPFDRNATGFLSANVGLQLAVSGPGTLIVAARDNIDLGTAGGIVSLGNTKNTKLAEVGADLIVAAGLGGLNNAEFAAYLLSENDTYNDRFNRYLSSRDALIDPDLLKSFLALDDVQQQPLLVDLFFEELIASGVSATTSGDDDYSRGFAAVNAFFDDNLEAGNLSLLLSRIATIDGGDVNLLVPNGFINGGVATSTEIQKTPDQLGIVAQRQGDVKIFVRDDLLVNQSRVFTLDGGRIAIWSSQGDIDAGRGAKSAVSIPGLITTIDTEGNVVTEFPPAVEGSGIRAAVASPGVPPGDVFLFAPRGRVIAGDAGIGSAGNLTIGATEVVGADNIDVGGVSIGVPSADVSSVAAGFTGASDSSTSAGKSAQQSAGDSAASEQDNLAEALAEGALSFISVEVLGFGG